MLKRFLLWVLLALLLFTFQGCTDPKKEVPILMRQLQSSSTKDQSQAALKLGRIGAPHAIPAVNRLIRLLNSSNVGVQSAVSYALHEIGTDKALRAVDEAKKKR